MAINRSRVEEMNAAEQAKGPRMSAFERSKRDRAQQSIDSANAIEQRKAYEAQNPQPQKETIRGGILKVDQRLKDAGF
jgi:hypothetical protein